MNETARNELEQIKEIIRNTVDPEGIYLFGSFAYGEPREDSDYDIYVVLPDDGPRPLDIASIPATRHHDHRPHLPSSAARCVMGP